MLTETGVLATRQETEMVTGGRGELGVARAPPSGAGD